MTVETKRERLWQTITNAKDVLIKISDFQKAHPDISRHSIISYLSDLEKADVIERVHSIRKPLTWRLVFKERVIPDLQSLPENTGHLVIKYLMTDYMWRTIKMMRNFTPMELAVNTGCSLENALNYTGALAHAGYIKGRSEIHSEHSKYVFIPTRNTGHLPPIIKSAVVVYDQNEQRTILPDQKGARQ